MPSISRLGPWMVVSVAVARTGIIRHSTHSRAVWLFPRGALLRYYRPVKTLIERYMYSACGWISLHPSFPREKNARGRARDAHRCLARRRQYCTTHIPTNRSAPTRHNYLCLAKIEPHSLLLTSIVVFSVVGFSFLAFSAFTFFL